MAIRKSKIEEVKALVLANGGWDAVYSQIPEFALAIRRGPGRCGPEVPCPKTGTGRTSFRLYKDWGDTGGGYSNSAGRSLPDGIEVLAWFWDLDKSAAMDKVFDLMGGRVEVTPEQRAAAAEKLQAARVMAPEEVERRWKALNAIFAGCKAAAESEHARAYFEARGFRGDLSKLPRTLGFHPALRYTEELGEMTQAEVKAIHPDARFRMAKTGGVSVPVFDLLRPGIVGIIRNREGRNVGLHRIFLTPDCKDNLRSLNGKKVKKMVSPPIDVRGCAIPLGDPFAYGAQSTILGVAEGIETALAVQMATGMPMWACISDQLLAQVNLPDHVNHVVIWADKDKSGAGHRAASELAFKLRHRGLKVEVLMPARSLREKEKSVDWLDILVEEGPDGFPYYQREPLPEEIAA